MWRGRVVDASPPRPAVERGGYQEPELDPPTPPPPLNPPPLNAEPPDDPELAAYNHYLAWFNANPHRTPADYPGMTTTKETS